MGRNVISDLPAISVVYLMIQATRCRGPALLCDSSGFCNYLILFLHFNLSCIIRAHGTHMSTFVMEYLCGVVDITVIPNRKNRCELRVYDKGIP